MAAPKTAAECHEIFARTTLPWREEIKKLEAERELILDAIDARNMKITRLSKCLQKKICEIQIKERSES